MVVVCSNPPVSALFKKISPEPFVTRIGMVVLECELDSHVKKWVAITTIGRDIIL